MTTLTEDLLSEMVGVLVHEIDPERVYVFGSYARGQVTPDSDVDLLIVERHPFGPNRSRWNELKRIRRILSGFRVAKDILVYSRDEIARWQDSQNHIISRCCREGRLLYERS